MQFGRVSEVYNASTKYLSINHGHIFIKCLKASTRLNNCIPLVNAMSLPLLQHSVSRGYILWASIGSLTQNTFTVGIEDLIHNIYNKLQASSTDINETDNHQGSALCVSIRNPHDYQFKLLIQNSQVKLHIDILSPLRLALMLQKFEHIECILERQADLDWFEIYDNTNIIVYCDRVVKHSSPTSEIHHIYKTIRYLFKGACLQLEKILQHIIPIRVIVMVILIPYIIKLDTTSPN